MYDLDSYDSPLYINNNQYNPGDDYIVNGNNFYQYSGNTEWLIVPLSYTPISK